MNTSANNSRSDSAFGRMRFALASAVIIFAAGVSALMLGVIGSRVSARFDLTSTREHQLSPQTRSILARLDRPVELVVAADLSSLDPALRQRTLDVLDKFSVEGARIGTASPASTSAGNSPTAAARFKTTIIDTSSAAGQQRYDELLSRLAKGAEAGIAKQLEGVNAAIDSTKSASAELAAAAETMLAIRAMLGKPDSTPAQAASMDTIRRFFEDQAAVCRAFSKSLADAAARAADRLSQPGESGLPVPPLDSAVLLVRPELGKLAGDLPNLNSALDRFALTQGVPVEASSKASELSKSIANLRDRLARRVAEIDAFRPLPIVTLARAILRTRAAILIADPAAHSGAAGTSNAARRDMVAIDPDALLPQLPASSDQHASLDARFRTEELIAAGVASMLNDTRPTAVFVHAGEKRLMPSFAPWWSGVASRLALRGIDCNEWPVMLDEQPPVIAGATPSEAGAVNPVASASAAPVVYIMVGLEVRRAEDAARLSKLSAALSRLIRDGKCVLVSAAPSNLPSGGAADPMAEPLEALQIKADTGLVLLEESRGITASGNQRAVAPDFTIIGSASPTSGSDAAPHAIASAVAGSPTYLPWVIPISRLAPRANTAPNPGAAPATDSTDVSLTPILTISAKPRVWAESEWLQLWQTPADQRLRVPQPAMDSPRDKPSTNDWWVGVAAERRSPAFSRPQRVVVIGSPAWYFDIIADAQSAVDGRVTYAAPGNFELLHASIAWLAGRDDLIARSAGVMASPRLPELSDGGLRSMRIALIGGVPMLVLVLGAIWRVWRG